jgi:hypothetical protein
MRDPEQIEKELIVIGAAADDATKLEEIIAWCAANPADIPTAIRILLGKAPRT